MEQRSLLAYSRYRDEASKLDHAVLAVIAAVTAYGAQAISPRPLAWALNAYNIELASLMALLVALFFAFKRVEMVVEVLRLNADCLHVLERRGQAMKLVQTPTPEPTLNIATGDIYTLEEATAEAQTMDRKAQELRPLIEKRQNAALLWYKVRNRFFLLGLALLVASRIAIGYEFTGGQ